MILMDIKKIMMVGVMNCSHCNQLYSPVLEYCSNNNVEFEYKTIQKLDATQTGMLRSSHIKSAPVFFVYLKDESCNIMSKDSEVIKSILS